MLRHLGLIAVCACIVASVGCDGGNGITPTPTVKVEFGGRVVNADAGGPVGNVRVSLTGLSGPGDTEWAWPTFTATSRQDGTFTFPLNPPMGWRSVSFHLTAPPGYDDRYQQFVPTTAADRPEIRMYPTLVIRPGESIGVRVDYDIAECWWVACRRVQVAASPGDSVELELVLDDSSKPMALNLGGAFDEPDMSVRRLMVPPGAVPYVVGVGTARLTAR